MEEQNAVVALLGLHSGTPSINISKPTKNASPSLPAPETTTATRKVSVEQQSEPRKRQKTEGGSGTPIAPMQIQTCNLPKTHVDHSYRDFSRMPPDANYVDPVEIKEMSFGRKLHQILSNPDYDGAICWMPHGRAFRVLVPRAMEQGNILSRYFGHGRYSTFLSQLKNNGFKMITRGRDRNCFYHECFLRGMPHLTKLMPPFKEARRLLPDPPHEPDFYRISLTLPVPTRNPEPQSVIATQALANLQNMLNQARPVQHPTVTLAPQTPVSLAPSPAASANLLQAIGVLSAKRPQPQQQANILAGHVLNQIALSANGGLQLLQQPQLLLQQPQPPTAQISAQILALLAQSMK